jgi:hypothetical protein
VIKMKKQPTLMKPVLALAIISLLALSVTPVLALNTIHGDMISNPFSGADDNPNHPTHASCYLDTTGIHCPPDPRPGGIVGACWIDVYGVKHCPYPPFVINPEPCTECGAIT